MPETKLSRSIVSHTNTRSLGGATTGASSVELPALKQVDETFALANGNLLELDLPLLANVHESFVLTNDTWL